MSVSRTSTCLFRRSIRATNASTASRTFSSSSVRQRNTERKIRPVYDSLPEEKRKGIESLVGTLPTWSGQEKADVEQHYNSEQLEALREAEKAIDPRDIVTQGRIRTDVWAPQTMEDFVHVDPAAGKEKSYARLLKDVTSNGFIPKVIRRLKDTRHTEDLFEEALVLDLKPEAKKFIQDLQAWSEQYPEQASRREIYIRDILHRFVPVPGADEEMIEEEEEVASSASAKPQTSNAGQSAAEMATNLRDAKRSAVVRDMGISKQEWKGFKSRGLVFRRVVNQTRMGKIASMYSLQVVGNGDGLIGIGEGKSAEMADATAQAELNAIKNIKPIHRYENRTIYGQIKKKVGGTTLEITAKPPGFGLRVQHLIYEMSRLAGIQDMSARVGRARNPMNTCKAYFEALTTQKLPEDIARGRGRKLVDLRKVYYDGKVY